MIIAIYSWYRCNILTNPFHVHRIEAGKARRKHWSDIAEMPFPLDLLKNSSSFQVADTKCSRLSQAYCASLSLPETSLGSPTEAKASDTHKDRKIPWYVTLQWKSQWHLAADFAIAALPDPQRHLRRAEGASSPRNDGSETVSCAHAQLWLVDVCGPGWWGSLGVYLSIYIYIFI